MCIVGYLRPEKNFDNLDALITAIKKDIADAERLLEEPELQNFKKHEFFKPTTERVKSSEEANRGPEMNGHL